MLSVSLPQLDWKGYAFIAVCGGIAGGITYAVTKHRIKTITAVALSMLGTYTLLGCDYNLFLAEEAFQRSERTLEMAEQAFHRAERTLEMVARRNV